MRLNFILNLGFEKLVLDSLTSIKNQLTRLSAQVGAIAASENESTDEKIFNVPVKSEEELLQLESFITSAELKKKLVKKYF